MQYQKNFCRYVCSCGGNDGKYGGVRSGNGQRHVGIAVYCRKCFGYKKLYKNGLLYQIRKGYFV